MKNEEFLQMEKKKLKEEKEQLVSNGQSNVSSAELFLIQERQCNLFSYKSSRYFRIMNYQG